MKEGVKKSFADSAFQEMRTGIIPVTSRMIKEQIQPQQRDDNRATYHVTEKVYEIYYVLNMADVWGLQDVIWAEDIMEMKRICKPGVHVGKQTRQILDRFSTEDKKTVFFFKTSLSGLRSCSTRGT